MRKGFRVLFICIVFCNNLLAQQPVSVYKHQWLVIDSLIEQGLPKSAKLEIVKVYDDAKKNGRTAEAFKAQLFLLQVGVSNEEKADSVLIKAAENYAATAPFPESAIWKSLAAELYQNYYQQHQWEILQRTKVADDKGADFAFWDVAQFVKKTSDLYVQSIARTRELQQISITAFDPILIKGTNTERLRPTLYDVLVFRAIAYFENDEKELTKPAFRFQLDDPEMFADANVFAKTDFYSRDSISLHWFALKHYQAVLTFHLNDNDPAALIDADIKRLAFVYQNSVLANKKDLYKNALERLKEQYKKDDGAAEVSFRLAILLYDDQQSRPYGKRPGKSPSSADLPALKTSLEEIIARYPNTEGAYHATERLRQVMSPFLTLTVEKAVLPAEPSKVLVSYRNMATLYFRVYLLDAASYNDNLHRNEDWLTRLLATTSKLSWKENMPGTGDYSDHTAEVKIDALPTGMYLVVASESPDFKIKENLLNTAMFQVSRLSILTNSITNKKEPSGYILDRKTGAPADGATVTFLTAEYSQKAGDYKYNKSAETVTGKDGSFRIAGKDRTFSGVKIAKQTDVLYSYEYVGLYRYGAQWEKSELTFFFTDRSIYRPGQTIFFKGIIISRDSNGRSNRVIAEKKTEVTLYDANGQKIQSQTFTTNEYGSFSGSFTAPVGVLTGNMRISNENGTANIFVEEYKRPKFQVTFDTSGKSYALNDTVKIKGNATAYSGATLGDATVKYRVVRRARWPYYWMQYRWGVQQSEEMEIINGTAVTDNDGTFTISFKALPDLLVDERSLPVYTFAITADVTDINGETHTGTKNISIGYTSLSITADIPVTALPQSLLQLPVSARNMDDKNVNTNITVTISKLKAPEQVLRKRIWPMPDQYVMDEATFKKFFPGDEYKDEADEKTWKVEKQVFSKEIAANGNTKLEVPLSAWSKNGWYVVDLQAKDDKGRPVQEKKYVQVVNPESNTPVSSASLSLADKNEYKPGQKARAWAISGYENMNWIRQEYRQGDAPMTMLTTAKGHIAEWNKAITTTDKGNIMVSWIAVRENRVYEELVSIKVPWTDKDLSVSWETFRDKLLPGEKENWTLVIKGPEKEKVAAEMVASLYDVSLDAFREHAFSRYDLWNNNEYYSGWNSSSTFGLQSGSLIGSHTYKGNYYNKQYDQVIGLNMGSRTFGGRYFAAPAGARNEGSLIVIDGIQVTGARHMMLPEASGPAAKFGDSTGGVVHMWSTTDPAKVEAPVSIRTNLNETAFFYPHLKTDAEGNIRISFTIPEALTEWKFISLAHTKDMKTGMLEGRVKTQKDLMVVPGLPRFLRQGDEMIISTKINNLGSNDLTGKATLQLLDANTLQPLDLPFRNSEKQKDFSVGQSKSTTASWKVHIPESRYEPVIIRITASAGGFTDGEENTLPVVTNRMMVTETLPLWMNGNGTKNFRMDKLLPIDSMRSLSPYRLTVEYTGNPAWYAVQALPYLMEYPYECAEQTFNRYYANALAAYILDKAPKVKAIFDKWQKEDTAALLSNLEKNEELKSALLEETPWVMEANDETEQKHRIALLFQSAKLSRSLDVTLRKLEDMMTGNGGFPWFKGSDYPDRYITQYIATGVGHLKHLGVSQGIKRADNIAERTLDYLDREIKSDYDRLLKNKADLKKQHIGTIQIQYLYMRSFFRDKPVNAANKVAYDFYREQAKQFSAYFNPYMKGMIALAVDRDGDKATSKRIIQSLTETAIRNDEMGMYWKEMGNTWWWHEAPIESQALLIECFTEVAGDIESADAMKRWLLKQKQTQNWKTTKATAEACYALLLQGTQWLEAQPKVSISLGGKIISSEASQQEAGTGYFKTIIPAADIKSSMGDIAVTTTNATAASWGAVYFQYFENLDKITNSATGLVLRKQLFIELNTDRGPELRPITESNTLKVGDKVKVRIELIADRDMEYVHLKDMRGACFEPINVISGYRWQGALGYYESTKDASSNFFISYMPKGKYVFEYPVFVTHAGTFSNGIATIQCMYAPEFSSHSDGLVIKVNP